jgi:hypothetical protein
MAICLTESALWALLTPMAVSPKLIRQLPQSLQLSWRHRLSEPIPGNGRC